MLVAMFHKHPPVMMDMIVAAAITCGTKLVMLTPAGLVTIASSARVAHRTSTTPRAATLGVFSTAERVTVVFLATPIATYVRLAATTLIQPAYAILLQPLVSIGEVKANGLIIAVSAGVGGVGAQTTTKGGLARLMMAPFGAGLRERKVS